MQQQGLRVAVLGCALAIATSPAVGSDTLEKTGDFLRYALPLTGLAATGIYRDPEGTRQWALAGATTLGTVAIGKSVTAKLRPDGGADTSYPSGHAAWAFWGASFLNTRYGAAWGIPAYGLAALTAYSRIDSGSHFPDDILAGASIALLSNWYWVKPLTRNTVVEPMVTPAGSAGFSLRIADAPLQAVDAKRPSLQEPRFRFEYLVAPTFVVRNEVQSPSSGNAGTLFDLADLEKIDDPTIASIVRIEWTLAPAHDLRFVIAPFEVRDRAEFAAPVSFDGVTYAAGVTTQVDYRFYDYRIGYRYALNPQDALVARIGVTLQAARSSFNLDDGAGRHTEVSHWTVLPLAHGSAVWRFASKWRAEASVEGMDLDDAGFVEIEATLRYRPDDAWEIAAGYASRRFRLDMTTLWNEASYRLPFLLLAHRW
jgi:hypothetical protein